MTGVYGPQLPTWDDARAALGAWERGEEPTLDAYEMTCEAAGDAEDRAAAAEAGQIPGVYGPQEATVDDVIGAVTAAMQTRPADPGYRAAWEHVDATGDSHLRSVEREPLQDLEAGW